MFRGAEIGRNFTLELLECPPCHAISREQMCGRWDEIFGEGIQ